MSCVNTEPWSLDREASSCSGELAVPVVPDQKSTSVVDGWQTLTATVVREKGKLNCEIMNVFFIVDDKS